MHQHTCMQQPYVDMYIIITNAHTQIQNEKENMTLPKTICACADGVYVFTMHLRHLNILNERERTI